MGEIYFRENFQGQLDGHCRGFRLTAAQAKQQFGEDKLPEQIAKCTDSNAKFSFLHRVCPRDDYDQSRRDQKNKPYASYYIAIDGKRLVQEGGYNSYPLAGPRYEQGPGEVYGRSPAMAVLPTIKTLNSEKRDFLVQGHRAGTPVLLTTDDGIVGFDMRPGALNKGGVNTDGTPLVHALPAGNIAVTKEMMDEERALINDAFLVTLFQILTESPQMTATEVIERTNEKGILLAPTVGAQQSGYLGPLIDRELHVLAAQGLLPPLPPALIEAEGEYSVVYTSPLSRAMRAQEVAGFARTLELAQGVVQTTQDPSILDNFNMDEAIRDTADIQAVPESWMAAQEDVMAKRKERARQMEIAQAAQAAKGMYSFKK
jgi:hypothetical protein